jgi:hypothetical protein
MGLDVKQNELRSLMIEIGIDPDAVKSFLEEKLTESRATDEAMKGVLTSQQFYERETTYTKIDLFLLNLK